MLRRSSNPVSRLTELLRGGAVCVFLISPAWAGELQPATQVGRYAVAVNGPTAGQRDLLSVEVTTAIPTDVTRVGESIRWLLRDSGYRLAEDSVQTPEVLELFELPLPAVHRQFESLPLHQVLALLVGPGFYLVHDPLQRLVAFERCRVTDAIKRECC